MLAESWSLDFGREGYTIFGLDSHNFDDGYFLFTEGDNNYTISITVFWL